MTHPSTLFTVVFPGFLLMVCGIVGICSATPHDQSVHTVRDVDIGRYMGKWYEIASLPNRFQKGCRCTTAEYRLSGNMVEVINACRKGSTLVPPDIALGKAFPVKGSGNAKFKVQFVWPIRADYWIIALDDNYEYAMVGNPKRKYLWILSRTPVMDKEIYQSLVDLARVKGYDANRLRRTDQSCEETE